jgi:hypothetical protein
MAWEPANSPRLLHQTKVKPNLGLGYGSIIYARARPRNTLPGIARDSLLHLLYNLSLDYLELPSELQRA